MTPINQLLKRFVGEFNQRVKLPFIDETRHLSEGLSQFYWPGKDEPMASIDVLSQASYDAWIKDSIEDGAAGLAAAAIHNKFDCLYKLSIPEGIEYGAFCAPVRMLQAYLINWGIVAVRFDILGHVAE